MIKVESKFKDFGIQIPTDISEITSEALDAVLTNVVIAKHYCVVALCQNESLFGVINNKVSTVEVMVVRVRPWYLWIGIRMVRWICS